MEGGPWYVLHAYCTNLHTRNRTQTFQHRLSLKTIMSHFHSPPSSQHDSVRVMLMLSFHRHLGLPNVPRPPFQEPIPGSLYACLAFPSEALFEAYRELHFVISAVIDGLNKNHEDPTRCPG